MLQFAACRYGVLYVVSANSPPTVACSAAQTCVFLRAYGNQSNPIGGVEGLTAQYESNACLALADRNTLLPGC